MPNEIPPKDTWVGDRTAVQAHLTMIQNVVARMATASASCKTWCLALLGAITSLAGATHQPAVLGYVVIVVAVFWFLDVRYLAQEKAYRMLFKELVLKIRDQNTPYSLDDAFELEAKTTGAQVAAAVISWSTLPMYLSITVAYGVAWQMGWIGLLAQS